MIDSKLAAANGGRSRHKSLVNAVVGKLPVGAPAEKPSAQKGPDVYYEDGSPVFDAERPLHVEVETSTVRKPASIIRRIVAAQEAGAKLVYVVEGVEDEDGESDGRTGDVDTLRRILTDPPLVRQQNVGKTHFYTNIGRLLTTDGDYVAVRREQLDGIDPHWWRDEETGKIHRRISSENLLTLPNPSAITEGIPAESAPTRVLLAEDDEETYRVVEASGNEWRTNKPEDELVYIKRPIVPDDVLGIGIESALNDIEVVVVTESGLYRQSLLPPVNMEKLGDLSSYDTENE